MECPIYEEHLDVLWKVRNSQFMVYCVLLRGKGLHNKWLNFFSQYGKWIILFLFDNTMFRLFGSSGQNNNQVAVKYVLQLDKPDCGKGLSKFLQTLTFI